MNLTVLICGIGKMAEALAHLCDRRNIHHIQFSRDLTLPENSNDTVTVAAHFGSGREWDALLNFCEERSIPIFQGSTSCNIARESLSQLSKTCVIDAPNLSLPIVKLLSLLPVLLEEPGALEMRITESHQIDKKDISGTARAMLRGTEGIVSVRDPTGQRALGVPEEHLDAHAYHFLKLWGQGLEIDVTIRVNGRDTYAEGLLFLAQNLAYGNGWTWLPESSTPLIGYWTVMDIIEQWPSK